MIRSIACAAVVCAASVPAAFAGPYVNVETNAGWAGDNYQGAVTDLHVGYEDDLGTAAGWYIQGGPALVNVDGAEAATHFSGKVGIGVDVTERLNVYGELSALTATSDFDMDDLNVGGKLGAKFSF